MKHRNAIFLRNIAMFAILLFSYLNLFGQTRPTPWYVTGNTQGGDMKFGRQSSEAGNIYFFNSATATEADYDMVLTYDPSYLGLGTLNPTSNLHIHSEETFDPFVVILDPIKTKSREASGPVSKSTLQLTNHFSGQGEDDGLFIESYSEDAIIRNEEAGDLRLLNAGTTLSLNDAGDFILRRGLNRSLTVKAGGNVGIGTDAPETSFEVNNGTLKISGGQSLGQDNARFVVDTEGSYAHRLMELRNNQQAEILIVNGNGNVGIGTVAPREKLTVNGKILAEEIIIINDAISGSYPDFVFEDDYKLMSLPELEKYIESNGHLPEIPKTKEVSENGMKLQEMNVKLLQKVEELTLYTIEQQKAIEELKTKLKELEEEK